MNLGDLNITKLCVGVEEALSACMGTQVVWSASSGVPSSGVCIVDSYGNIYTGTYGERVTPLGPDDGYLVDFQKLGDATWTLYEDGQVVTADTYWMYFYATCEGDSVGLYEIEDMDYPVEDIDTGTEYDSSTTIAMQVTYFRGQYVYAIMLVEDCDGYWGKKRQECEGVGCWDNEGHECLPCADPCDEYEPGSEDECICRGGTWTDDGEGNYYCDHAPANPCDGDPCLCDPNPDECNCMAQGGTWDPDANDGAGDCILE